MAKTPTAGAAPAPAPAPQDAPGTDPAAGMEALVKGLEELAALCNERQKATDEALAALNEKVGELTKALASDTARLLDGDLAAAELVEGYSPREELLKVHRQLEAVANHLNIRLPV